MHSDIIQKFSVFGKILPNVDILRPVCIFLHPVTHLLGSKLCIEMDDCESDIIILSAVRLSQPFQKIRAGAQARHLD